MGSIFRGGARAALVHPTGDGALEAHVPRHDAGSFIRYPKCTRQRRCR
jgi:hypothetical protein